MRLATTHPWPARSIFPRKAAESCSSACFSGDISFNDPNFHRLNRYCARQSQRCWPSELSRDHRPDRVGSNIDTTPWITHRFALLPTLRGGLQRWPANPGCHQDCHRRIIHRILCSRSSSSRIRRVRALDRGRRGAGRDQRDSGRHFDLRAARHDDRVRRRHQCRMPCPSWKKMGFRSINDVRRASEAGADVEAEGLAARSAGTEIRASAVRSPARPTRC